MNNEGVLALISDTHLYRAGLPLFFHSLQRHRIRRLACLGDCESEPFQQWLLEAPDRELYWVHDVFWPDLPEATLHGMAVAVSERIFLAHTRATVFISFKRELTAYKQAPAANRPPLLLCHGHTHTPSVTRFGHSLNQILYINTTIRHRPQPRQELVDLAPDSVYLVVPGAFTLEEGRFPNLNFTLLDLEKPAAEMVSLAEVKELEGWRSRLVF